jgi:hypothetical protein
VGSQTREGRSTAAELTSQPPSAQSASAAHSSFSVWQAKPMMPRMLHPPVFASYDAQRRPAPQSASLVQLLGRQTPPDGDTSWPHMQMKPGPQSSSVMQPEAQCFSLGPPPDASSWVSQ